MVCLSILKIKICPVRKMTGREDAGGESDEPIGNAIERSKYPLNETH